MECRRVVCSGMIVRTIFIRLMVFEPRLHEDVCNDHKSRSEVVEIDIKIAVGDKEPTESPVLKSEGEPVKLRTIGLAVRYSDTLALKDIDLGIPANRVTAIIGPSGCGKSTLLRCFNRMNDLIPSARIDGTVLFNETNLYGHDVDATEIRYRIGMVFQRPNPFPKSVFDNVAFGLRINGFKGDINDMVEQSLKQAALWDEVKDRLKKNALALSGGQQQRLCIARALAVNPEVILMDEPCSSLDPIATLAIEDLIRALSEEYTIIIVTHNMQQAARVSDETAFLTVGNDRAGYLVEHGNTREMFTTPKDERTEAYITGRFG